ncbi:hypothetical protein Tsubulata_029471, partial [Turnera subulata]
AQREKREKKAGGKGERKGEGLPVAPRCGKSCRLRWMNYLRPDIKRGNITPDEGRPHHQNAFLAREPVVSHRRKTSSSNR